MNDYKNKYLKYKSKYLKLKIGGGSESEDEIRKKHLAEALEKYGIPNISNAEFFLKKRCNQPTENLESKNIDISNHVNDEETKKMIEERLEEIEDFEECEDIVQNDDKSDESDESDEKSNNNDKPDNTNLLMTVGAGVVALTLVLLFQK